MPAIVVTEDVTQPEMSLLNCELSANMPNIVVTADVSHVPMSSLNWAAFQGGVFRGVELRAQHCADGVRRVPRGGL